MEMQQAERDDDVAYMLASIKGVIGSEVQRSGSEGFWPGITSGVPSAEWQRSLLRTALHAVAAVSGRGVDENVRVESNGFVVIAQSWEGCRISIMAKMGTPHTKSLARAIRRVRAKVEQPAKVVASTADKTLDIRPDNA